MDKEYKCPNCEQDLVKKEKLVYECPGCQKAFIVKKGQLFAFTDDTRDIDNEDKDEIEKIDEDIETLEMLNFFDDDLL